MVIDIPFYITDRQQQVRPPLISHTNHYCYIVIAGWASVTSSKLSLFTYHWGLKEDVHLELQSTNIIICETTVSGPRPQGFPSAIDNQPLGEIPQ